MGKVRTNHSYRNSLQVLPYLTWSSDRKHHRSLDLFYRKSFPKALGAIINSNLTEVSLKCSDLRTRFWHQEVTTYISFESFLISKHPRAEPHQVMMASSFLFLTAKINFINFWRIIIKIKRTRRKATSTYPRPKSWWLLCYHTFKRPLTMQLMFENVLAY